MNTYYKYVPNVFLAKCDEMHEKGEEITLTTKYGGENECIVHNLIFERDGFYYYSIVRADGFNRQEWASRKAERYQNSANNAARKSHHYYNRSNKDADFLSLGEPIKVGHHSEKRHRKMIDDAWRNMGKSVELAELAEERERKAAYWEAQADKIDLSMPESIEFFAYKLEKAKKYHEGLRSGKYPREHSYSLTYAKKDVNELTKKYELALKLWGETHHTTNIDFGGNTYTCRVVKDNEGEDKIIGGLDLLDALHPGSFEDENEGFANEEAEKIYDEIFFFIDAESLKLGDENLIALLKEDNPEWFN